MSRRTPEATLLAALLFSLAGIGVATITGIACTSSATCQAGELCGSSGYCFIPDQYGQGTGGSGYTPQPSYRPTPTPTQTPAATTSPTSPSTTPASTQVASDGSISGDPQFIGLDGRLFYFDGLPHKYFNLLSEKNHQLNALFVPGPHKINNMGEQSEGTFLGEFGLKAYGTVLEVRVDENGYMSAVVDGERIGHDELAKHHYQKEVEQDKNVVIRIEEYKENLGQAITVTTPVFDFIFFPTLRHWDPEFNETTRGHLNLALKVKLQQLDSHSLHGVLGQTTPERAPDATLLPPELQLVFLGEGTPEEYMVSSLLGDDFRFNQFSGPDLQVL